MEVMQGPRGRLYEWVSVVEVIQGPYLGVGLNDGGSDTIVKHAIGLAIFCNDENLDGPGITSPPPICKLPL